MAVTSKTPMPGRGLVLASLAFGSFAVIFNAIVVTPILPEIAEEFSVSIPLAGQLVTFYALPAAVAGVIAGPFSDRYGRRPLLLWSTALMFVSSLMCAAATGFVSLSIFRALAGATAGALLPIIIAAVADLYQYEERGRAIGWVISANTLAGIFGVPIGAILAELTSWRAAFIFLALFLAASTYFIYRYFPRLEAQQPKGDERLLTRFVSNYRSVLMKRSPSGAIIASFLGAVPWFAWVTYIGAFYATFFNLSTGYLAPIMAILALGILVGGNLGGRLGDRIGHKRVILGSLVLIGVLLPFQLAATGSLIVAALLTFLFSIPNGARFASNSTLITELTPESRGTATALSGSFQQLGAMLGAAGAGILIGSSGYGSIGWLGAAIALAGAAVTAVMVKEGDGAKERDV